MDRWALSPTAPTTMSTTTFKTSCSVDRQFTRALDQATQ